MPNPHKGEIELVVDGKTYRMALSMHSLSLLRKRTGISLVELGKALEGDADPENISAVLWAAIQTYHPDVSFEDVARMVPAGGMEELTEKMQEVFVAAFPKQNESAGNPPNRAAKKN
jgi:hypothetical protein